MSNKFKITKPCLSSQTGEPAQKLVKLQAGMNLKDLVLKANTDSEVQEDKQKSEKQENQEPDNEHLKIHQETSHHKNVIGSHTDQEVPIVDCCKKGEKAEPLLLPPEQPKEPTEKPPVKSSKSKLNFECEKCHLKFKLRTLLEKHKKTCTKSYKSSLQHEKTLKCPICGHRYKGQAWLDVHIKESHSMSSNANHCEKKFEVEKKFEFEKKFECGDCGKKYVHQFGVDNCKIDHEEQKRKEALSQAVTQAVSKAVSKALAEGAYKDMDGQNEVFCDSNDDYLLQKVKEIIRREEDKSFTCKICQIDLPSKSSYDQHWEQVHGF